jgi:hypothetical protein
MKPHTRYGFYDQRREGDDQAPGPAEMLLRIKEPAAQQIEEPKVFNCAGRSLASVGCNRVGGDHAFFAGLARAQA